MKKDIFKGLAKTITSETRKNLPVILTTAGVIGMGATVYNVAKTAPRGVELWNELHEEKETAGEPVTKLDVVKKVGPVYLPAAVMFMFSVACLYGANSVSATRTAALATAYKLSESAYAEYRGKTEEVVGEKKVSKIKEMISQDRIDKFGEDENDIIITNRGNDLYYDSISGRRFRSSKNDIERAVNQLNKMLLSEDRICLNDFYDELGIEGNGMGDMLGWHIDDGLIEIGFNPTITKTGEACICIEYYVEPIYYYKES